MNVDMLKLIQLGLTFTDAKGNLPRWQGELCVWQFNFRGFRLTEDVYAQVRLAIVSYMPDTMQACKPAYPSPALKGCSNGACEVQCAPKLFTALK